MLDVDALDPVERLALRSALVFEIGRQQRRRVDAARPETRNDCDARLSALDAMLDLLRCR